MRIFHFIAFFSFCFLLAAPGHALDVEQIRFGDHAQKTRLVVDLSQKTEYRVFTLSDPYRLVVDLPRFDWQASPVSKAGTKSVSFIRHGQLRPDVSRIVFEMKSPVQVLSAFTIPPKEGKPDRLVIDFTKISASEFAANRGKTFGNLTVDQGIPVNPVQKPSQDVQPTKVNAISGSGSLIPPRKPDLKTVVTKPLIILDPGHGGQDPGAIGANKVYEKDIALSLARELKKQLEATGFYRVKMTRETDVYIRLRDRVNFARKNQGDLFISIHADSIDKPGIRGASIYTLSETASDKETAKLAARENRSDIIAGVDLSVEDEQVASILMDLATRDTLNQSKFFANKIVRQLNKNRVKLLENPHRFAGFAVLKAPDIPSILVEAGFISNRHEADMLTNPEHRRKIANALKDGIHSYFEYVKENEKT